MNITVINYRKGPFGTALGFFDINLDDVFVVKGCALKKTKDGSKYYYQAPSKARTDKQGNPVKDEKGFAIYDSYFDLYGVRGENGFTPTEAAWEGRDNVLKQAVAAHEGAASSGRGSVKSKAAAATAGTVGSTDDADDDDLPF